MSEVKAPTSKQPAIEAFEILLQLLKPLTQDERARILRAACIFYEVDGPTEERGRR